MNRSTRLLTRRCFTAAGLSAVTSGFARAASAQAAAPFGRSVTTEVEKANLAIVDEFCAAFARKDVAAAVSRLSDACSYRTSQGRPPIVGKAQVAATITRFIELGAEFKVLRSVVLGPIVLNERDDIVVMTAGAPPRTFHIAAGMFFVENGKIVEWTDFVLR